MKDKVLGTNPPANQTSAITNEITIVLGAGPESRPVPDVKGQTGAPARQVLTASGFVNVVPVQVDSPLSCGQVIGTCPLPAQNSPVDTPIQLQVSKGNQFVMPDVTRHVLGPTPSPGCARWAGRADWTGAPTSRTAGSAPTPL